MREKLRQELLMQGYTSEIPREIKPRVIGLLDQYLIDANSRGLMKGAIPFHEVELLVKQIPSNKEPAFPSSRTLDDLSYGGKISIQVHSVTASESKQKYALLTIFHHVQQKK